MKFQGILIAAVAALAWGPAPVAAQPNPAASTLDPNGYYNPFDPNGYFDRQGQYHPLRPGGNGAAPAPAPVPAPATPGRGPAAAARNVPTVPTPAIQDNPYYQQGRFENDCRRGVQVAGTIFPATGGGIFGGSTRGPGGEVSGGVVLDGGLDRIISPGINCDDQAYAFGEFATGLNGDVGRRRTWHHGDEFGEFQVTREFQRGGLTCRDFTESSYRTGRTARHKGTACLSKDGQWHFD